MRLVGGDGGLEPGPLAVGELLDAGAEHGAEAVERVALAAPVTQGVLLDLAAALIDAAMPSLTTDMEGIEDRDAVLELGVDGVLVAVERVERGDLDTVRKSWLRVLT
nr:hypothetical protein [Nocardioides marmotae]